MSTLPAASSLMYVCNNADARFLHFELTHAYFDIHTPFLSVSSWDMAFIVYSRERVLVALSTHVTDNTKHIWLEIVS